MNSWPLPYLEQCGSWDSCYCSVPCRTWKPRVRLPPLLRPLNLLLRSRSLSATRFISSSASIVSTATPLRHPGLKLVYPPIVNACSATPASRRESPAIQKLAAHETSGKPLPWARIYTLPKFVWFSHQSHHQDAGLACEQCHGPVSERHLIVKEKPTSMEFCMDCHAQRAAPNGCDFCHNLQ